MQTRRYYRVDDPAATLNRVLIIEHGVTATVFCPPGLAGGPWLDHFTSLETAEDLASLLAEQHGQPAVFLTRDEIAWWLNGLSLIGDADDVYREDVVDHV